MLRFHKAYFILTFLLFLTEVLIVMFAHDNFVRPYLGDYLVVILIYCFLRSFISVSVKAAALFALIFSYAVETLQYFDLVGRLGLRDSRLANIILGNSFSWTDILAYTLGILTVLVIEHLIRKK